jgi:hypothetical protein
MLLPEDPLRHLQNYRPGAADQYGQFEIRGIPPGSYALVAWLDVAPCDVYDPADFETCRAAGMGIAIEQADDKNVVFMAPGKP